MLDFPKSPPTPSDDDGIETTKVLFLAAGLTRSTGVQSASAQPLIVADLQRTITGSRLVITLISAEYYSKSISQRCIAGGAKSLG